MPSQISSTALFSRVVVNLVFFALALSFLFETAVMLWEFRAPLAMPMATFDGHLFLFFPTFGIIVLLCFRRAAIVLVDAYWRHIKGGKFILLGIVLVISAIAAYFTITFQSSKNRQWWEVDKQVLLDDRGEPAGCQPPDCDRAPVVEAYSAIRLLARSDRGLTDMYARCEREDMTIFRPQDDSQKFCFATGATESVPACCAAKERFKQAVTDMHAQAPSTTYRVHAMMLPFKAAFLLMLLAIGVTLARRRPVLEEHYPLAMKQVERTMPIGAISMMIWPLMNQAYTVNFDLLYGSGDAGAFRVTAPMYTVAFAAWVAILLFYYFRRYERSTVGAAKAIGGLLAGLSILNFDTIMAGVTRYIGAGANFVSFAVAIVVLAFLVYETVFNPDEDREIDETEGPVVAPDEDETLLEELADIIE
jgi:hypothetical protein